MNALSILVADDHEDIRRLLKLRLTAGGHAVACAASGNAALKLLRVRRFDLLITDVLMPDGDGLELIMHAKKAHAPLRILAIAGGGLYCWANYCLCMAEGLGAHAVLAKPFGQPELLEGIQQAMGGSFRPTS